MADGRTCYGQRIMWNKGWEHLFLLTQVVLAAGCKFERPALGWTEVAVYPG
jgi:hypothetical protein